MADLSNHVSLTISQDSVGVARAGFGIPMIVSYNTSGWGATRARTYGSLSDVVADFASTTGPEYLAASSLFSQSPRPESIMIGRGALPPTQKFTLTPTARNAHVYRLRIGGDGVTETDISITSDADATATEIVAALITPINAIVGKNFTATGTTTLILTANTAGEWFFVEVIDVNDFAIVQDHADPGIATDIAAIELENSTWYALITLYNSNACVLAAAADIAARKKIYLPDVNDTGSITAGAGNSDTLDDLATLGYSRVMGMYHPALDQMPAAAWLGRVLPLTPGSESWKFKTLQGVAAVTLTSSQRANLVAKHANSIETVAGIKITFEGTTSDGDFLDVQRGIDWIEDDMAKGVFGALAGAEKVAYTDEGVALITAQVRATLVRAVAAGILTNDPAPVVTAPKVATVSTTNRALRRLPDVKFSATLAGAIHKVIIAGVVSV